ncbi:oxidoreductase [Thioclava sp. BHET1]|nr:oxidoreductase [Thioclava sp. BHET1]
MTPETVLIIGAGQGGLQAAISLRQSGFAGTITLIGGESGLPYQRPPLSKAYLRDGKAEALYLRPESFFDAKRIDYRPDTWVEAIDRTAQRVTVTGQSGAHALPYDHLILATGTRNLRPPIEGIAQACDLRTLRDAQTLRDRLSQPTRIAVIGGGFIGLEFAAVARALGHEVAIIEAAPRLMARAVSAKMSAHFAELHRDWGNLLHLGQAAIAVEPSGVTLADGTKIASDFVLLAAGVRPNTELAEAAGLACDNGVRTDARLLTSDPAISALGDYASFPDPRSGAQIRLESVQAATDHARLIAKRIAKGDAAPYSAQPWFWSDQGPCKLQIAGFATPDAAEEEIAAGIIGRFDASGLAAIETLDNARAHMRARKLMASPVPITRAELEEIAA